MTASAGFVVRPAHVEDLTAIAEIESASFAADPWPRQSFEVFLSRSGVTFIVAEDPAEPVIAGYAILLHAADEAELLNLAVAHTLRRRGVGRALLASVLAAAAAHGIRAIYLEVRDSNDAARKLYSAHGFAEVGRRLRYYERPAEDALILQRVVP